MLAADGSPRTPKSPIYPEATRHLPGNAADAILPSLTGIQPEIVAGVNRRVHERIQSLRVYVLFTLGYGAFSLFIYTVGKQSLNDGALFVSIPGQLQHVGLASSALPVLGAPILLNSRQLRYVKAILAIQLMGYAVVFVTAFGLIVTDFTNFFFGVGLVAVVQVFLGLWTRSVLIDVRGLRETEA